VLNGQRTVVAVFVPPVVVMTQDENKAEAAGKLMPIMAYAVQTLQNDRDAAASKDMAQYLPDWDPAAEFYPILMKELPATGHPGKFIMPADGGMSDDDLKKYNGSTNVMDWRLRYYYDDPDHPVPRNYSTHLDLDDALLLEVNFTYGLLQDDQQNGTPELAAMTRLFRVNSMHLLWKHENVVDDKPGQKMVYEFKQNGGDLLTKWRKLMPSLAQALAADYKKELVAAGLYLPGPGAPPLPRSTTTVEGLAPAGGAAGAAASPSNPSSALPSGWAAPAGSALPSGWAAPPAATPAPTAPGTVVPGSHQGNQTAAPAMVLPPGWAAPTAPQPTTASPAASPTPATAAPAPAPAPATAPAPTPEPAPVPAPAPEPAPAPAPAPTAAPATTSP